MKKLVLLAALMLAGCGSHEKSPETAGFARRDKNIDKLASQAAFDLQCTPAELQIVQLSSEGFIKTFGVRGCGRQGTYKLLCSMFGQCSVMTEAQAHNIATH
jgi:hypothetical protein